MNGDDDTLNNLEIVQTDEIMNYNDKNNNTKFFEALDYLKLIKESKNITNIEKIESLDLISEYSKTCAHFSREEYEKYLPQGKKVCMGKFQIPMKKYNHKIFTQANMPYKMNIKRGPFGSQSKSKQKKINKDYFDKSNNIITFEELNKYKDENKDSELKMKSFHENDFADLKDLDQVQEIYEKIKFNNNSKLDKIHDNSKYELNNHKLNECDENSLSKILIIDSNNCSFSIEGLENKTCNIELNRQSDLLYKHITTSKAPKFFSRFQKYEDSFGKQRIQKSRITSKDSILKNNFSIDNMQSLNHIKNESVKSFQSPLKLSSIIEKIKITQSNSIINSKKVNRNLIYSFNDLNEGNKFSNQELKINNDILKFSITDKDDLLTPNKKREKSSLALKITSSSLQPPISGKTTKSFDCSFSLNTVFDVEFVNNLIIKDRIDKIPNNFLEKHIKITNYHRSLLLDWLMELSEEFAFKRDTFHYAIAYIDKFLSKTSNFQPYQLQLLGLVSLSISAKIEEIQIPKNEEYILSSENAFTSIDFLNFESYLLKVIDWNLHPSNPNIWLCWYLCQWDVFLDSFEEEKNKLLKILKNNTLIYFKKPEEKAYFNYRQVTQLLDIAVIDSNYVFLGNREIVAATIYLIVFWNLEIVEKENQEIIENQFNNVFIEFMTQSFGFGLDQIKSSLEFLMKFKEFKFSYELPLIAQTDDNIVNQGHYEDFLSYQIYNQEFKKCFEMELIKF